MKLNFIMPQLVPRAWRAVIKLTLWGRVLHIDSNNDFKLNPKRAGEEKEGRESLLSYYISQFAVFYIKRKWNKMKWNEMKQPFSTAYNHFARKKYQTWKIYRRPLFGFKQHGQISLEIHKIIAAFLKTRGYI